MLKLLYDSLHCTHCVKISQNRKNCKNATHICCSIKKLADSHVGVMSPESNTSRSVIVTESNIQTETKKQNPTDEMSHNVSDYMAKLHKQRQSEDPEAIKRDRIKLLRKLLKKL